MAKDPQLEMARQFIIQTNNKMMKTSTRSLAIINTPQSQQYRKTPTFYQFKRRSTIIPQPNFLRRVSIRQDNSLLLKKPTQISVAIAP